MIQRAFVIGLTFIASSYAQQAEAPKTGVIEGKVVNAKTGQPIRRVNLSLRPMGTPGTGGGVSFQMPQAAPYATSTDAEGKFRFENVEPATYRLSAERQGFVRKEYGSRQAMMPAMPLQLSAGQEMKKIDIEMMPQAVITGRIYDDEGEPLAKVQVQVVRRQFIQGKERYLPMQGGSSSDNGDYRISDLAPGRYWVSASFRRMTMEGPARNAGGKPEEEYVTTMHPSAFDQSSARALDLEGGQEATGIDIRMLKSRVFRIRGKVVGATASASRPMRVMVMPRSKDGGPVFMAGMMGGGAQVKDDGTFEIGGVPPGAYSIIVPPMNPGAQNLWGKAAVDVNKNDVEGISVVMSSPISLTGTVQVAGDLKQFEQKQGKKLSLAGLQVQLMPYEGVMFSAPAMGPVAEDGSFTLANASLDKYRIMVYGLPAGTYLKSVRNGDQDILENGIDITSGAAAPIEISLGVGTGQLSGSVQDAKSQAAAGSMVSITPDPPNSARNDLFRFATSDQNGRFTLEGLAPGTYRIIAWDNVEVGRIQDPEFLKKYESKGQKIVIKENSQEQLTLNQVVTDPA